jgi:Fe-S cluster assembly ATP-binding protein
MLEMKNVSFILPDGDNAQSILKDINLSLKEGRFYVITGPNGSGKSTLAKVIMGIYPASSGRIFLDKQDITDLGIAERAKLGIGYSFQQPPRFKGITVRELLEITGCRDEAKSCKYLFDVGLCPQNYLDREINSSLSGGELKRIEIATLLYRPLKVAVFDEPEAGIDLWSFRKLTETFQKFHQKKKMTTIIISHQERILRLADEIILISDGRIEEIGTQEKLLPRILQECECKQNCMERVGDDDECY